MNNHNMHPISYKNVKINDKFWLSRMELIAKEAIPYQWDALNDNIPSAEPSHAIENFRIAAGKSSGEFHGMFFQDSDVAKWLEAASYSLLNFPNPQLEEIIDEVIALMAEAQQPDGYLNTYYTVAKPEERWKDFSYGHELYSAGHMIEAAVAYFDVTGKRKLLDMMCRYVDYIDSVMGPEDGKKKAYCGHEEIELALMKLYRATGEKRYLKLAQYFIDERGKQPSYLAWEPTFNPEKSPWFDLDYHQAHKPVREQTKADGHAVRVMYLSIAMADLAFETGDETLVNSLRTLWENVTQQRMYITGAIGSQSLAERFTFDYDLPNDTVYGETCATIGLFFWGHRMMLLGPDSRYGDVMERTLYNGALSGISWDGKRYFYVNPLEVIPQVVAERHDHHHVKSERQQWFGCSCCPTNIARLISSLGQYIYSQNHNTIYTHLFIDSTAEVKLDDQKIVLEQKTKYPWNGKITITLQLEGTKQFKMALRLPGWCRKYGLKINGNICEDYMSDQGYAIINNVWTAGDQIELDLEMPVELVQADPRVRENAGKVALQRGPVVYCLEEVDNGNRLWNIKIKSNVKLDTEYAEELFAGVTIITGEAERVDLEKWDNTLYAPLRDDTKPVKIKAVPYSLWGNRGPGEMMVWLTHN